MLRGRINPFRISSIWGLIASGAVVFWIAFAWPSRLPKPGMDLFSPMIGIDHPSINQTVENTSTITYGQTVTGTIATPGQVITYTFTASAGDVILVGMSENNYYFDPEIRLYDPGGSLLNTHWSSGERAEFTQTLSLPGSYTLLASDNGGTDTASFGLFLQRLNNPGNATPLPFGQTASGSVSLLAEMHTYTFTASAGDVILAGMSDTGYYFDPELRLYDPGGSLLASNWSSGEHTEFTQTLSLPGSYTLLASDNGGTDTASYGLFLQRLNNPGNATPLPFGQTASGSISILDVLHTYTFTASAGDVILAGMSDTGYYFGPELRLYDPGGSLLNTHWSSGEHTEFTQTLSLPGSYTLLASDYGGTDTASYGLFLQRLNNPVGSTPIGYGETINGSITQMAEMDVYTFVANAGDKIWVRLSDDHYYFDPEIRLYTLDGNPVTSAWSSGNLAEIRQSISITDTYVIWVGDNGGTDTANYVLSLLGGETELVLPLGAPQEILVYPDSPLTYRIDVPASTENLFITLQKYASWGSELVLYDGNTVLASGNSDQILQFQPPTAQSYTLTVTGSGSARLTADVALPEIPLGQWKVGAILHSWGSAWYQYTVPDGQSSLFIKVETIGLWSQLKVYPGALGNTPYWNASGPIMDLEIPSPEPGIYYVHLTDSAWIQGSDPSRDHLIRADVTPVAPAACTLPTITSFTPAKGGTAGPVTIQIQGQCFDPQPEVCLTRPGESDICAPLVIVDSDGRSLAATFNLASSVAGEWSLTVTNPPAQSAVAPLPFTIESGGESKPWVEIVGRQTIRSGRQQTFYVRYGNTGNIDAQGIPLWIDGIPIDATWELGVQILSPQQPAGETPIAWDQVPKHVETGDQVMIPLLISTIPPGHSGEIPVTINVPSNRQLQLRARINPMGLLCSPGTPEEKCISGLIKKALGALPGASCILDAGCWVYNYAFSGSPPGGIFSMIDSMVGVLVTCAGDLYPFTFVANTVMDVLSTIDTASDCINAMIDAVLDIWAVTSISPEDKFGPIGWDPPDTPTRELQRWIPTNRQLAYRIDFWNKEEAPAATVDVIITDTLDADLDWATFSFTEIGFLDWQEPLEPTQYFNLDVENVRVDLSPYYPNAPIVTMTVNVEGNFNPATGEIQWEFHALEPGTFDPPDEPLAGFLPPITDSGWEIGWVAFSVSPRSGLASGTVISNQSFVKFDLNPFNPAPPGGPFINTLDSAPPVSAMQSLTGNQMCNSFWVSWAGQDDSGGSGLASFDVYVDDLEDAAPAYLWQAGMTNLSALFSGFPGHRYGFYTRARDHAGNIESHPEPVGYDIEVTAGWYCNLLPIIVK